MTQLSIQKQLDALTKATKEASKTRETARQFLIDAGIVKPNQATSNQTPVLTKGK